MIQRNAKISHAFELEEYCLNGNIQSNLQIQCNPYENTHDIFHRTRTNNTAFYKES